MKLAPKRPALYKYNPLIMEVNAAMRFDRRPELNAGWIELGRSLNTTRRSMLWGAKYMRQNSVHHDTGDGGVIEKEEVADIVRYAEQHGIQVIPEVPSLSHSYYLLTRHRELAEVQDAEWPDTYCPLNPKSYELLFDVLDEVVE
ncbi:MAG: family 20 glycosylhydrolase, partial [Acidobacteria bacterium]|nr:family 20 glycosylhydrolase [Acidobacteriota bacterium]